ncbi:calcium-binding protein [Microvirga terrestris]|uniref:Calcium-binding protein n=1 Tax=Microvirga terrestris TaxID=2791024 RepID=A0ABS0HWR0_9HYPH|nr:calcium-binding protein [Microvirga terrestris]MBF9197946.1 calcium-binding protein [Microvirga terrestris]
MADFIYSDVANLSLDEVLVGAVAQATSDADHFTLINPINGYTITFFGTDFTYSAPPPAGGPTGGSVSGITLTNASGVDVLDVDLLPATPSLATFWSTFSAAGFTYAGSAAAFTALLAVKEEDAINGGSSDDRIGVYGAGGIILGDAGNDTFLVNEGVNGAKIFGTVTVSTTEELQTDVVEIRGNASIAELHDIDLIRFADTPGTLPAKALSFSGNPQLGNLKTIQGSATGIDTIKFTSASEASDIDIHDIQFVNWNRPNQTILVDLNTNNDLALDDRFVGSAAGERVTAGNGRDLLYGNAGDDYLDGGDDIDVLDGGEGNDTLIGGNGGKTDGPNILKGGNGNDVYKFNEKADVIIDTGGLDSRMVSKNTTMSTKDKLEGLAADEAAGGKSINLTGNTKANLLIGHNGKNSIKGMNGNDILEGRLGADKLDGGAGNDKLYGGLGNDNLTGGAGKDTFYFDTFLGGNVDKIVSFSTKDDRIALDRDIFTALTGSKLASSSFYIGTKAKDAGDRIIYNKSSGALSYDADGSGTAVGAIKFATLDKNLKLSASDFILV